jgi:hypothetical protein
VIFPILRRQPHAGERENLCPRIYGRGAADDDMAVQPHTFAKPDAGGNDRIWSDHDGFGQIRPRLDNGRRVNIGQA